jgi:hypothetical protein
LKILHLIRKKGDAYPLQIVESQKKAGDDVKVVFLQDGVFSCTGDGASACCTEDADARGVSCGNKVDYKGIIDMIFDADSVINW